MTRDDIIRMAKEAGFETDGFGIGIWDSADFNRFAALVAAAEREKVAAWMRSKSYATGHGDTVEDLLKELEWQVAEREREACAMVAEEKTAAWTEYDYNSACMDCAKAIRARGEA